MTVIDIDKIRMDGGTQSRAEIDPMVVDEYAQAVRDGADLPAVVVFHDGKKYWLADGFHRVAAYRAAGAMFVEADVRQGDKRQAILFSVGANATHGLRRTNDDKRRAVQTLLGDKEWSAWSNREIARRAGVSEKFVRSLRPERSEDSGEQVRTYTTKYGTTSSMDTSKIGAQEGERQAEFDRQRDEARDSLPDEVKAHEARKAEAVASRATKTDGDDERIASLQAEIEELRNVIADQKAEIDQLRETLTKYDDMVAEYERGGFEEVISGLHQRIANLQRQVERESEEKVKNLRSADRWRKKAIEAGANDDIEIERKPGEASRG